MEYSQIVNPHKLRIPENIAYEVQSSRFIDIAIDWWWGKIFSNVSDGGDGIAYLWDNINFPYFFSGTLEPSAPFIVKLTNSALPPPTVSWDAWFSLYTYDALTNIAKPYYFAFSNSIDNQLIGDTGIFRPVTGFRGKEITNTRYLYALHLYQIVFSPENYFLASNSIVNYSFGGDYYVYNTSSSNFIKIRWNGDNSFFPDGSNYARTDVNLVFNWKITYVPLNNFPNSVYTGTSTASVGDTSTDILLPSGWHSGMKGYIKIEIDCDQPDWKPILPVFHCSIGWYATGGEIGALPL